MHKLLLDEQSEHRVFIFSGANLMKNLQKNQISNADIEETAAISIPSSNCFIFDKKKVV